MCDAQLSIEERDDGYWALLNLLMILPFAEGKDLYWRELKQTKISLLLFFVTFLCSGDSGDSLKGQCQIQAKLRS